MNHLGLFEGIGGFSLAARWMGWKTIAWCEWNEFGQKVLRHHFPEAEGHGDITKTDFTKYANTIDILTGGFPCQPYSSAGKRLGKEDDRHLWPEMLRVIREVQPTWVVGENVFGLVNWSGGLVFDEVQSDLEAQGYEVQPYVLPAVSVNAPHRRDRVWFVAYCEANRLARSERTNQWQEHQQNNRNTVRSAFDSNGSFRHASNTDCNGLKQCNSKHEINTSKGRLDAFCNTQPFNIKHTKNIGSKNALENGELERRRFRQSNQRNFWDSFPSQSPICNGDDGFSNRLDSITFPKWRAESIKAGGNAIVPQVAYQIFKTIEEYEKRF
jgi:DNA (cytosine-5)-methyltransferase 1